MALADELIGQVDAFVQAFSQNAHVVPEGKQTLADAHALSAAARNFRQAAGGGAPPRLSPEFRTVEETWQRISRRSQRIAGGRTGPNIQKIALIGQIIEQIHQAQP